MSGDVVIDDCQTVLVLVESGASVVVDAADQTLVLKDSAGPAVVALDAESQLVVSATETTRAVVSAGTQGPPGPPGPPGGAGAAFLTRTAGAVISALSGVYERDGLVYPLSYDDGEHAFAFLGLAVSSGQPQAAISVQLEGSITDAGWSWAYDRVYLGRNGQLTQTPPSDGYSILVGFAASPDTINLSISDPIEV